MNMKMEAIQTRNKMYSLTPKVWCKYLDNDGKMHYVIGAVKPTYLFLNDYAVCWYANGSHLYGWLIIQLSDKVQQKFPILDMKHKDWWEEYLAELEKNHAS
jgi:hypothetical protein